MKNYLFGYARPVYNIWGPWKGFGLNPSWQEDHKVYEQLYKLSRLSAKHFLQGEWEEVCVTSPVLDARLHQINVWYTIKELWLKEPCNILCMGADTLFIKPTEVFGRYDKMTMFNYTDPKTHSEVVNYFNDDVRYYPASMDPKVWEMGEKLMDKWFAHNENNWAAGQIIHNLQMWSQGVELNDVHDPNMAFQVLYFDEEQDSKWNGSPFEDAHILHLHGSRGIQGRLPVMEAILTQLGIEQ